MTAAVDPLTGLLSAVAMQAMARFRDHNLSIRRSKVVHAVAMSRWMAGVQLPAPACHVGVAGWAIEDLRPTRDTVTCLRCLRAAPAGRVAEAARPLGGQLALPIEVDA
ncbi:hypothetical protein L6E12_31395 [Actinokineospora sp. PR83]|uniref:hypothetical protein n=1 Tax=Actinokineospora sp. PR83 TaxID=2884908 RepID=UPI001F237B33|nr:hypothetical protein [Actinokineospora sp. PR83]MCG8920284.1 hypothetical protein [Actinokineospora sp. PR83]